MRSTSGTDQGGESRRCFIELLTNGTFQAEADINQDGVVSLLGVEPFVELFSVGE